MKTTKGFDVFGMSKYFDAKNNDFKGYKSRLRVDPKDPYHDEYVKWDTSGKAIDHNYGNIKI